jgi:ABC-type multidrug transport system permease subunit
MREIGALLRAAWLTEASYRTNMLFSLASLVFMVVPLYFVAGALQPMMTSTIASQSRQYFAFALLGTTIYTFIAACMSALPSALGAAIGRGTLEAFLGTPTRVAVLFTGMSVYNIAWAFVRACIMIAAGMALGVQLHWSGVPALLVIMSLLILAYGAFGLIGSALILQFRTTGPILSGILTASALLGGVYYPTHVLPSSWLRELSAAVPLSYGLRAARQAMLLGDPVTAFGHDVLILALFVAILFPAGVLSVVIALRRARHAGTLGQY